MPERQFPRESQAAGTVLISRRASLTSQRIILGCLIVSCLINVTLFVLLARANQPQNGTQPQSLAVQSANTTPTTTPTARAQGAAAQEAAVQSARAQAAAAQSATTQAATPQAAATAQTGPNTLESSAATYQPTVHRTTQPSTEDWPAILDRRSLRVLVTPSRTNFFIAENRSRGFELEMFRQLEEQLNRQHPNDIPFRVVFVPVGHDQLMPSLLAGHGDVAAAMLTVTQQRQEQVAFTTPYLGDVSEVIVRHRNAPAVASLADLSGKTVVVAAGTGYLETLARSNEQLSQSGHPPIQVLAAGNGLVSEDLLELVHSGSFHYTLIDKPFAELWSHVLEDIVLTDLTLANGRQIAWAVRPNNPKLRAQLNSWAEKNKKGSLLGNILFKRYYTNTQWLKSPLIDHNDRWETYRPLFEEAGKKYGYDWHLLAMQGYQESRLDPSKTSHSGAEGIMQLLPATAKDMGCTDTRDPRANIMAGAKYMDWLRRHFFADETLTEDNRIAFCLAAYNAGFGRVRRWREDAPQLGYDPNQWFNHVEHVALQQTSMEPVRYVGNIVKTNTAFSLYLEQADRRQETVEQLSR